MLQYFKKKIIKDIRIQELYGSSANDLKRLYWLRNKNSELLSFSYYLGKKTYSALEIILGILFVLVFGIPFLAYLRLKE